MRKNKILLLVALICSLSASAQLLTQSPYSRYGLGEQYFQGFSDQVALGSTGLAQRHSLNMNILNPASYSALRMTNFRLGATSFITQLQQGNQSITTNSAGLRYLTLAFQLNKKKDWGLAFGALPYSGKGYTIQYTTDSSFGSITNSLSGSGDLTRFFLGTGKELGDHISVGVQASYIFGKLSDRRSFAFPSGSPYLNYRESATDYIGGFMLEGGLQAYFPGRIVRKDSIENADLTKSLRRDTTYLKHSFGLYYQLSTSMNITRELFSRTYLEANGREYIKDTIQLVDDLKGNISLPSSIGFGYQLEQASGKWRINLDYRYNLNSLYKNSFSAEALNDYHQVSFGYGFRPSTKFYDDKVNFLKKTEYRIGARYSTALLQINNTDVPEYGISFGLGIPLRTRTVTEEFKYQTVFSSLNVSVEYVQRGTLQNNLVQENYWRFVFGVSLNDKWFNKRKID
ncbi:MAG: hypothetical protein EP332_03190 [Bacteroidetes bacterium]|nr:MAG: hypothetical protein EP332_03190 [Bacteroidota bacterium]